MSRSCFIAVCCLLVGLSGVVPADEVRFGAPNQRTAEAVPAVPTDSGEAGPIALETLESMALSAHPAIVEARANVQAARGAALQAGLAPNPTIGYAADEIGDSGKAGMQGAVFSQRWITGGKLSLARSAAAAEADRRQQQLVITEQRVINDVRRAYFAVLAAGRRHAVASQLVGIGQQGVDAASKLLRAQEVTRSDLLEAEIETNSAEIERHGANAEYQAAWRELAAVVGTPDLAPRPLVDLLDRPVAEQSWQQVLNRLVTSSPELSAALAHVEQAEWTLDHELATPHPDIDTTAMVQYDNASQDTIAGLMIEIPIFWHNRNQGAIRRAEAELASARAAVYRTELSLQHRLASVYRRYAEARYTTEKYRRDILPRAQQSLDLARRAYEQGERDFLSLLIAQRTLFRTELAYIKALDELHQSVIAMEGWLLEGSLKEE